MGKTQRDCKDVVATVAWLKNLADNAPDETMEQARAALATVERLLAVIDAASTKNVPAWKQPGAVVKLAVEFSRLISRTLKGPQLAKAIERNRAETSKDVCHTHDFCDANMVMDEAYRKLKWGRWTPSDKHGEDSFSLWNDAWGVAKAHSFDADKIPGKPVPQESEDDKEARYKKFFETVCDKKNWKNAINAEIPEADQRLATDAIIYFTGSVPEFGPSKKKGFVKVYAAGYYSAIGS